MCARGVVHPQALLPMKVKGEIKNHKQQEKDDIVQDADFAADFTGPKLTSDGTLCACGDHSFVQFHGYVRNRRQCHTAGQKLR